MTYFLRIFYQVTEKWLKQKFLYFCVQVELLEWADDLEMHHLKGYGETINYRMGVPLLDDVVQSMDHAIAADSKPTLFMLLSW